MTARSQKALETPQGHPYVGALGLGATQGIGVKLSLCPFSPSPASAGEGRGEGRHSRASVMPDSAPDGDPHVDRRQSPTWLEDFDRIQIHLSDLREFFDQPRDAQQQIFDGLQVSQRLAPVAL